MKNRHIPEIDGLRAFAILAVMAFHLGLPGASFGWVGVEVFFVISGYLITGILLNTREKPCYLSTFYIRRTLRIFPIYYLVLGLVALAYGTRGSFGYYLAYLQTVPQLASDFKDQPMLGHTWTLAIEEQFYLLWPFVVLFFHRRLAVICGALLVVPLALRFAVLGAPSPFWVDGWLPVQVDTLAAGALLAVASRYLHAARLQLIAQWVLLAGLGAFLAFSVAAGFKAYWTPYDWARLSYGPILISIFAMIGFGLVGLCAVSYRPLTFLRWAPLQHIGKISYGLYLYHPFVFSFVHRHVGGTVQSVAACMLGTYLVAILSWVLIEKPILSVKDRMTGDRWITANALTTN